MTPMTTSSSISEKPSRSAGPARRSAFMGTPPRMSTGTRVGSPAESRTISVYSPGRIAAPG